MPDLSGRYAIAVILYVQGKVRSTKYFLSELPFQGLNVGDTLIYLDSWGMHGGDFGVRNGDSLTITRLEHSIGHLQIGEPGPPVSGHTVYVHAEAASRSSLILSSLKTAVMTAAFGAKKKSSALQMPIDEPLVR